MAFPTGWGYKVKMTIQNGKVAATQTDFAVLCTESNLSQAVDGIFDADGANPALNGGGDIRASSDAAGATQLPVEVVSFVTDNDPSNGKAEIWVKVASVSSSGDTDFYLWWGKAGESQPAEDSTYGKENVWRSEFKAVWHLNEDPSGSAPQAIDSTANDNDGTSEGGMTSGDLVDGKWGKGWDFDGTGDAVNCGNDSSLDITGDVITLMAWVKPDTWNVNDYIVSKYGTAGYGLGLTSESINYLKTHRGDGSGISVVYDTSVSKDTTNFGHYVVAHDASNAHFYTNGAAGDSPAITKDMTSNTHDVKIAKLGTLGLYVDGIISEVRILEETLSANDVTTHYNNESDPSTFVTMGSIESATTATGNMFLVF